MLQKLVIVSGLILGAVMSGNAKPKEKDAPGWVTEVATRPTPTYPGRVSAVVLFYERKVTVDPTGTVITVTRRAVKVLTHEGKREAEAVEPYEKGGSQVKELRAWLVAPSGLVKTFDKNTVEDLGAYSDELYNDYRLRRIRADNPEMGSVFVYESELQEKAVAGQDRFAFQDELPAVESRYSITVPTGWTVSGALLNHEPVQPIVDGSTSIWVLKGLAFQEHEQFGPQLSGMAPTLGVDFRPPAAVAGPVAFQNWSDVSHWHATIAAPQAEVNGEMERKVHDLTAGLSTEYEKIRAIGNFVQKFRYVEIAMDLSHNGGVRPHLAADVFAKQYGDCKDKANLMHALLQSAGIRSYLVAIYLGDRTFVKKEWASPSQFNHMIVAVQVRDATKAPTVIDSPLGRVLLFDPTDPITPFGDLPWVEQGSYALLCAGARGDLLRMPLVAPEASVLSQTVEAILNADGSITAALRSESTGQAARRERGVYVSGSPEHYKSAMERNLTYYVKGAAVAKVTAEDSFDQDRFSASLNFSAAHYAQLMQGRMLLFSPDIVSPAAPQFPSVGRRSEPIILNGKVYRKHVIVKLPPGFTMDEMPSPFSSEAPFAQFSVNYRQAPGELVMDEELRTEALTLPASEYGAVKKFFDAVWGADAQNAVLVKN